MKPIKNQQIAIIGGGPGGLTLARLLQMQGLSVKVYERDINRSARVQGATLNLNDESGLKAIHVAGLIEPFRKLYRPGADRMNLLDPQKNLLFAEAGDDDLEHGRPEIDRGPLRELLLDSLQDGTVIWNKPFARMERDQDGVLIVFKDGTTARADLVIAADGANSRLRAYVTPLRPIYSGVTVVEGIIEDVEHTLPELFRLLDGGKSCVLGDAKTLFILLKGDGSAAFYSGHKADEFWSRDRGPDFSDREAVVSWFREEFAGWDPLWVELFRKASSFVPRPQYCAPLDQQWEAQSDLTLLGDAAHVMPPYAGEGVNMAMQDAMELAACLASDAFADSQAAIAAYETQMRARASETARETMEFTGIFHSPEAASFFVKFFKGDH